MRVVIGNQNKLLIVVSVMIFFEFGNVYGGVSIFDKIVNGIEFRAHSEKSLFQNVYDFDFKTDSRADDLFSWAKSHNLTVDKSKSRFILTTLGPTPRNCDVDCEAYYLTDVQKTNIKAGAIVRYLVIVRNGTIILIDDASSYAGT